MQLPDEQALARSLDMNPVYQNLRMQLSQADADLAEMRGQIGAQQGLVNDLRSRVDAIPEIEAELVRLDRDYEVNKKQYDTLVQRLESARISEDAEQSSENVKFRVIEPPAVPFEPSGPKRLALDTLVLLAALGAGVGLAVLLAQLHPTFTSRDVLEKVTGIPVLGSVTAAIQGHVHSLVPPAGRDGGRGLRLAGRGLSSEHHTDRSPAHRVAQPGRLRETANEHRRKSPAEAEGPQGIAARYARGAGCGRAAACDGAVVGAGRDARAGRG